MLKTRHLYAFCSDKKERKKEDKIYMSQQTPAPTPILAPNGLPYPITIDELLVSKGESVERGQRLFAYKFWYVVEIFASPDETDGTETTNGNKKTVRESIEFFESPYTGVLTSWNIEAGDEIATPLQQLGEITRPCNHDIVYNGLCTQCGKEVESDYGLNDEEYGSVTSGVPTRKFAGLNTLGGKEVAAATIMASYTDTNLRLSRSAAQYIDKVNRERLLKERKLILVVDLDQTVIHCGVDPTIGEWKCDPNNPNYNTLRDVYSFNLEEEPILPFLYTGPKPPPRKCCYYVKVRPGLAKFFEQVAPLYEMHIYTMATRAYALQVAKIIDPDKSLFGDRILSRDESGSLTQKSLERLFPTDQSMVVVMDDRGDVWNWSPNLIKVIPYNFFVGVGDINSNFLPKQQTTLLQLGRRSRLPGGSAVNSSNGNSDSNSTNTPSETSTSDETNTEGNTNKPEQSALEGGETKEVHTTNDSTEGSSADSNSSDSTPDDVSPSTSSRSSSPDVSEEETDELLTSILDTEKKLKDEIDQEVKRRERKLNQIKQPDEPHSTEAKEEWAKKLEYSASVEVQQKNRPLAELQKHLHHNQTLLVDNDNELYYLKDTLTNIHTEFFRIFDANDENHKPDIQEILPRMEGTVFRGCHFVFSGLIPLNTDIRTADIVIWTNKFGAETSSDIDDTTTHVITRTPGTFKARLAKAFNPEIKIVHPDWIFECLTTWKRVDESLYTLIVDQPVSESELLEFKEKLARQKEEQAKAKLMLDQINGSEEVLSSDANPTSLFADGASWLNDDEYDEIPFDDDDDDDDDDADNDKEDDNRNGDKKTNGIVRGGTEKRALSDGGDSTDDGTTSAKRTRLDDGNSARDESESDLDQELLDMLDS